MTTTNDSPGFFGKLPNFADFVKFNSGNSELLLFDKWLQNGIQYSKNKFNQKFNFVYSSSDMLQFIFPTKNLGTSLIGTLLPSNDKSGRNYPFIISKRTKINPTNIHLTPLEYHEFYSITKKYNYSLKEIDTLENLIAEFENMYSSKNTNLTQKIIGYEEYKNVTTSNQFWNSLFGSFDDVRKYLLFYNLKEILLPLRGKQINNFTLGLKIPISNDSNFILYTISFWVEVCSQFIANRNILPYLFWNINSNPQESYLLLFFKQPLHDIYANLIDPSFLMDNICLTEKEGSIENCLPALGNQYKELLDQKELTLSEFIKKI